MNNFRYENLGNESIITALGTLTLDENGFVTNQSALKISDNDMADLPGILDNRDFVKPTKTKQPVIKEVAPDPEPSAPEETPEEAQDAALDEVVAEQLSNADNLNSQGALDMGKLNSALLAAGLSKINGAARDASVARVNAR